jgi:hypothetical protein
MSYIENIHPDELPFAELVRTLMAQHLLPPEFDMQQIEAGRTEVLRELMTTPWTGTIGEAFTQHLNTFEALIDAAHLEEPARTKAAAALLYEKGVLYRSASLHDQCDEAFMDAWETLELASDSFPELKNTLEEVMQVLNS